MTTADLRPLSATQPGTSADSLRIQCIECATPSEYGNAARGGWKYDPSGPIFRAYYCPKCQEGKHA